MHSIQQCSRYEVASLGAMSSLRSEEDCFGTVLVTDTSLIAFHPPTCKFATLIYQILGSEMSVRAPPLLSPYVFVLLPTAY